MEISKRLWLLKYYYYNALFSKAAGKWESWRIERHRVAWEEIRNELAGTKDMLIVGNGPSLKPEDLTALSWLPSIASNKIYIIFYKTQWRPTLFTICDPLLSHKLRTYSFDEFDLVLCSHRVNNMLRAKHTLPWLNLPFEYAVAEEAQHEFKVDPINGFFEGFSITVQNIQIALWIGVQRIFLIGCDHFYKEEQSQQAGRKLKSGGGNHFDPDYRKVGEIVNNAPIERMNRSYEFVSKLANRMNVQVINLSRRSALSLFPKVQLEEFLQTTQRVEESASKTKP